MATNSIPITDLPASAGRIDKNDLFLMSKKVDSSFDSKKLTYATLTSNISTDILPLVPSAQLPIVNSSLPLTATTTSQAYSAKSVTQFYTQTKNQITDINNNKLSKSSTTEQSVAGTVNFKSTIKCPTSSSTTGTDVVNIDYLRAYINGGFYVTEFGTSETYGTYGTNGWYKVYANGWCEQGGRVITTKCNNIQKVEFIKEFKDSNYTVNATPAGGDLGNNIHQGIYIKKVDKNTNYKLETTHFWFKNDLLKGDSVFWTAQGFIS